METKNSTDKFSGGVPRPLSIKELTSWLEAKNGSRLFLPPIQRSIVWSNEQVINYWDSLLRGYPAGMMIVHRVVPGVDDASRRGYDEDGTTHITGEHDYQLFDGQQRMSAILLGLGRGQMKSGRKLWIDFGADASEITGLKFQLRISSTGQPFGYTPNSPSRKIELGKRHEKWKEWRSMYGMNASPQEAFKLVRGKDLIDQKYAVSFIDIFGDLAEHGREQTVQKYGIQSGVLDSVIAFITALENALASSVIIQQVGTEIVSSAEEYIRFFKRLGQGGTRLSNDELTYSIIKHQYPEVREKMQIITQGECGRLTGEVDIVIATLRSAKLLAPWDGAKDSEILSRPDPEFVSKLKLQNMGITKSKFLGLLGIHIKTNQHEKSPLDIALIEIREALSFNSKTNQNGLPAMLLSRLPSELIDVLVLFAFKADLNTKWTDKDRYVLCAFVLHWLLFVRHNANAAWYAYEHANSNEWSVTEESIRALIKKFELKEVAYFLPREDILSKLRIAIESEDEGLLRSWGQRFTVADGTGGESKPGEALRVLSTNNQLIKDALLWLQRRYIANKFPYYDPTSDRDEDLPIDLDHIVPSSIFGFHWSSASGRFEDACKLDKTMTENFHSHRYLIGNSLGNYRWLDTRENRERQDGVFVALPDLADFVEKPMDWNELIETDDATKHPPLWKKESIAKFQRLIDLRTLELYKKILTESGIGKLV